LINGKSDQRKLITALGCGTLILISLLTFQQQVPSISNSPKVYDKLYAGVLKEIGTIIPPNESLVTSENYPQVGYFTEHKAKFVRVDSEKSLLEFMLRINSSYLLVSYYLPHPRVDKTPLFIKLVETPIKKIYYDEEQHSGPVVAPVSMHKLSEGRVFDDLFEKIRDYRTEESILSLYRLRSNVTHNSITDQAKPLVYISTPINGTTIKSESQTLRLNITGTAIDKESRVKKVEVSVEGLVFQLAKPKNEGDWSKWSFPYIVTPGGTKEILVRATDNAYNEVLVPIYIKVE
jgi:hypothetical protein